MNYDLGSRRGSRVRALTRSLSYSEAIGNSSERSSIEIPSLVNTDVYANEELKKQYRISQTYVEGREIAFPSFQEDVFLPTTETVNTESQTSTDGQYSSEDDHEPGLVLTIDVETETASPRTDTTRNFSDVSTRQIVSSVDNSDPIYDRIEVADSVYEEPAVPSSYGYSSPYTRRRKKGSRHRRMPGRPTRSRRVVYKNGEENVPVRSHIPAKSIKYMRDLVNTVINSKWRFLLLIMIVAHFAFWLIFASIWLAVSRAYADDIGDGKDHCVIGTSSFAGLLMMSVETQMTIGYGQRFPSEECPEAIFVMVIEIIAGTALSGGLTSLLFTKLVRPNRHVTSVGFSKKATVCLRDGQLCLQFRVWDLLNVHMINSTITAYMLKPIRTLEGELVQNYIHKLELKQARAFLLWPITVVHIIDKKSPLYDFSAQDMMDYRFEIVVCLQGSSKNMGTVTQSRTSYLSKEIIWGYRFKNVLRYSKKKEAYVIETDDLHSVEQVETPLCSSSRLKVFEDDLKSSRNFLSRPHSPMTLSPMAPSPTNLSLSRTNVSSSHDDPYKVHSVQESPALTRISGTQRSFGWSFKKFYPEKKKDISE